MKAQMFACIILLSFISCSNAIRNKEKANSLEEQGLYQEAILYLDKAIEEDSTLIDAYLDRGVDRSILGDYIEAIQDYSKVIQLDSLNILAYYNRAKNYYRIGNMEIALIDINKAYNLATANSFKIDKMNVNLHVENIYDDDKYSIPVFDIIFERGLIFLKMDSIEKAYVDIDNCIDNEFSLAQSLYWRGIINLKMGYMDEACDDLNRAYSLGEIEAKEKIEKYCHWK